MKDIRIGLIGAGFMGKAHATAFKNVPLVFGNEPGRPILEIIADVDEQAVEKRAGATWRKKRARTASKRFALSNMPTNLYITPKQYSD